MRKLFILFMLMSVSSYGQDSTNVSITEAERIIDKYSGKAVEGFNKVVKEITPTIKEGFQIAIKLQIAKGIASLLPLIFFIISSTIFYKEYKRIEAILDSKDVPARMRRDCGVFYDDNLTSVLLISLIFSILMFIIGVFTTYDGVTHLVAPEWFAIKEIIELFK